MDYKEKYEKAIERMKSWARGEHPECFTEAQKAAEFIFPELKESEDEMIKKEIINYFKCQSREEPSRKDIHNKWITWLEKQGEQNPAWSEEDEKQLERAIYMMEQLNMTKSWDDVYNWLKSLKPQPRWKPTEEQLIDKACEWIEKLMVASGNYDAYDIQENLKDFKKSMKG